MIEKKYIQITKKTYEIGITFDKFWRVATDMRYEKATGMITSAAKTVIRKMYQLKLRFLPLSKIIASKWPRHDSNMRHKV